MLTSYRCHHFRHNLTEREQDGDGQAHWTSYSQVKMAPEALSLLLHFLAEFALGLQALIMGSRSPGRPFFSSGPTRQLAGPNDVAMPVAVAEAVEEF